MYNPARFRARWRLYEDFARYIECAGGILYTGEIAFGDREFAVTEANNPRHLQLRTRSEMWLKEAAINLLIQRLPLDWAFVAYIDADMMFARPDVLNETLHALQQYDAVQMFSEYRDLGPDHQLLGGGYSYMARYLGMTPDQSNSSGSGKYAGLGAPGGAWAFRRDAWDGVGGLLDVCILGSGDLYMAQGLTCGIVPSKRRYHPRYIEHLRRWQDRAQHAIKRNVGVVPGLMLHSWHGKRKDRGYGIRDEILTRWQYNPDDDLQRDWQGLYRLSHHGLRMRDDIRRYARDRNEDSVDVE